MQPAPLKSILLIGFTAQLHQASQGVAVGVEERRRAFRLAGQRAPHRASAQAARQKLAGEALRLVVGEPVRARGVVEPVLESGNFSPE